MGRFDTPRERRIRKREATRKERRVAKVDPENAPTRRRYAGWAD